MKYRLQLASDYRDYRATAVHQFRDDVCISFPDDGYQYFVDGVEVSRANALAACEVAINAKWDKKSETHKRVRVSVGASTASNTYREVWIKR
jgi:hypothetical protein